jgi:hypothetical protein
MCCFSPVSAPVSLLSRLFGSWAIPRVRVADTSIFARFGDAGVQCLAYSMELSAAGDVAMILPLPVVPGSGEGAVTFVSLERHARFFETMRLLFEIPATRDSASKRRPKFLPLVPKLKVHEVGSFEASFVPTMSDFARLDERFRLPDAIWRGLGDYADWGFAVFRLKAGKRKHIHPMALRFLTRDRGRLFFPTVHVHDGKVHARARFDHALYYQTSGADAGDPRAFMRPSEDYEGLVARDHHVFRRELRGTLPNRDTWIASNPIQPS